jgi:methylglutaconyl-CoA hydratase
MSYQTIEIDIQNSIATIWLNRPEVRNALNETMIDELDHAFKHLGWSEEVRVVVLAGRGSAFCAGGDLQWMQRMATYSAAENESDAMRLAAMLSRINRCPKPTIARVHGPAFAGGMGLSAACDIVIASKTAEFCLSEVKIGLVPATIAPYVLQALGVRASRRYMLTAERISADEAHRIGFVHEVRESDDMDDAIGEIAKSLRMGGPAAIAISKYLIGMAAVRPIDSELIEDTARLIAKVRASAEGREGVDAFLGKRKAAWNIL